jgi:hypothetical protein
MNSNTNGKFNVAGDRPLGAAKPVDPATRLSELLAQSLEELTRPFDPPRVDPLTRAPATPSPRPASESAEAEARHSNETDMPVASASRLDDKALAELEAELFAAAAKPASEPPATSAEPADKPQDEPPRDEPPHDEPLRDEPSRDGPAQDAHSEGPAAVDLDAVPPSAEPAAADPVVAAPALAPAANADDPAAANLVARVRRLMLISMAVTIIAVGSVFGFIGYRVFKGEGSVAKTADKLPDAGKTTDEMTLTLPRGARVVQSAVSEDRLIITLDVGGKIEVRTFDLKTLQPAGRLTFSTTP